MDPKIFIIVLNWNRAQDTVACISSLTKLNYSRYNVVVVDNASQDGSAPIIKRSFPSLVVIENASNLGYAEGNKVGICYALAHGAEYVLVLNNDTVVDSDMLTELVRIAESDRMIGIVGPKIYDFQQPTKIWFAGANIDWSMGESHHIGLGEIDRGQFDGIVEVDRLTGCAMLIKRDVFTTVGMYDPDYFLYFEDVDFCVRAHKAGYKNICVQTAKVWHKESSTTGANKKSDLHTYYHTRNRLLFLKRHGQITDQEHEWNKGFRKEYIGHLIRHPFDRGYRQMNSAKFRAIRDFYRGRFGIRPEYHEQIGRLLDVDQRRSIAEGAS